MAKKNQPSQDIANNPRARHDYLLHEQFEAGLALHGWEVKALRARRGQIKESYIILRHGEAWLVNGHISPLETTSTHHPSDPTRTRKLLLKRKELNSLQQAVSRKGFTVVPLSLYWSKQWVKIKIALGKGKKKVDKREADKEKTWRREQARALKNQSRH